jgi:PPOX class probable F420-dependent enzyme
MLEPTIRDLAQAKNFAVITVHLPSGNAATQVMWVHADDEHILMNTEVHRTKFKALEQDPRVTVTVWDQENPYHYAEVRGRVAATETGPAARAMIDELSRKYTGQDYQGTIVSERVILRIAPERQRITQA